MNIVTALSQTNRWWTTGKIDDAFLYNTIRSEFEQIHELLSMDRILSIIGPRRVGKSTLLLQTVHSLLAEAVSPKRILMFSGDDPTLFSGENNIHDIIEAYATEILNENLNELTGKIYIFIDEIHTLKDWQIWLKHYYDRKLKIKFIVSGSSSTHLFEGSKESLLGRIESVFVMPLSFSQYCKFWSVYRNDEKVSEYLSLLPAKSVFENPSAYFDELSSKSWQLEEFKPYVNKALKEYLMVGGYPEYFIVNNQALWQKRLVEDIIGQGLYRDIISVYSIKNPERLERLLYFIASNNGQDFNFRTIAETLGCDGETVSGYLSFLQQAYLVIIQNNYSTNTGKSIRKNRKLYILDNGICNALLRTPELNPTLEGHIIEACCVRDAHKVCERNFWKLDYWRDGDSEVDIIVDRKTSLLPVEVKYRNSPKADNLDAFRNKFMKNGGEVLVITKDTLSRQNDVISVPYWMVGE